MKHSPMRYYIICAFSFFITALFSYFTIADHTIPAITIMALILSIPLILFFLFIDFTFTINGKYYFMKFFYAQVVVTFAATVAAEYFAVPIPQIVSSLLLLSLTITTIGILALFFFYAIRVGQEGLQANSPHAMHTLADMYQKRKDNPKPWEEQFYDFFVEKFQGLSGKKKSGDQEKVNV